jgi:hypothetical protein
MTFKITPPSNINNIGLVIGWIGSTKKIKDLSELVCAPYYVRFGMWEMIYT